MLDKAFYEVEVNRLCLAFEQQESYSQLERGLALSSRTECYSVARRPGAGEGAGAVIVSVAIRRRAGALKQLGVVGRPARRRRAVRPRAAEPRVPERLARALASHHRAARPAHRQLVRALPVQVPLAARPPAVPRSSGRRHRDGDVVAIHEADVIEVRAAATRTESDLN